MKTCTKCGDTWPLDEQFYHRKSGSPDGFASHCKACVAEYKAARRCPIPATDHDYAIQYREGWEAQDGEPCPWPASMLGPRCAWLAGYRDRRAA